MLIPENLKESVLATLAYFDVFNHPLKPEEIRRYLFRFDDNLRHVNLYLKESPKIQSKDGYFFLRGHRDNLVRRYYSEQISRKLWKKVHRVRFLLALIPYVRMVAVCNTLAFDCADRNSDIDLFIATRKNRLFTARLLVTFWLHILGLRRHGQKIAGRFCLSFYVSERALNLARIQILPYDIYLAYWLKTLQPIVDKNVYAGFLEANKNWIRRYFEVDLEEQNKHLIKNRLAKFSLNIGQKLLELPLDNRLGDWLEQHLKKWQKKRAETKKAQLGRKADIIISDNILKFHNIDRREEIRKEWEKSLMELKLTEVEFRETQSSNVKTQSYSLKLKTTV